MLRQTWLLSLLMIGCGNAGFGGALNGGGLFGGELCSPFPIVAAPAPIASPERAAPPLCVDAQKLRARVERAMGRGHFDRAIRLVKRAQERKCEGAEELSSLADEARAALAAVEGKPENLIRVGLSKRSSGQPREARKLLDAALVRLEAAGGAPKIVETALPTDATGYSEERSTIELLRFSLNGRYLVLTGGSRFQALFDFDSQAPPFVGEPEFQSSVFTKSMAISPDGMQIAFREDNAAILYSTQTGKPMGMLLGHEKDSEYSEALDSVAYFWDGRRIATGDEEGTLRIFEKGKENAIAETRSLRDELRALAVSPSGQFVASAFESEAAVRIRALQGGATYAILPTETDGISDIAWSENGRYLAAAALFGAIDIWDLSNCHHLTIRDKPDCHRYEDGSCGYPPIYGMSISPDGSYVAATFDDVGTYLWDATSGKRLAVLPARRNEHAWSVAFSRDGKLLAIGSSFGVSLYRMKPGGKPPVEPLLFTMVNKSRHTDGYAIDRSPVGAYDVWEEGDHRLGCRIGETTVPLAVCEDRLRIRGLVGLHARGFSVDPLDVDEEP